MRINNKNFNEFNMKINSFTYQPISFTSNLFQSDNSLNVVPGRLISAAKPMNLIAEFNSKVDISRFMKEIVSHQENIIDVDDEFIYKCYFNGCSSPNDEYWQGKYRLTIPFLVISLAKRTTYIKLRNTVTEIINPGTFETPLVIKIISNKDISSISIFGYNVSNLKKGETMIIDGENKKVFSDFQQNRFNDVEFKKNRFPFLESGKNIIDVSSLDGVEIDLSFRAVYI